MNHNIVRLLAFVLAVGSAFAAGSKEAAAPAPQAKRTIRVYRYMQGPEKKVMEYAKEQIEKKFPNVTIELMPRNDDQYQEIKIGAASGNMPEVYECALREIITFKKSGDILKLNPYISRYGLDKKFLPAIVESWKDSSGDTFAVDSLAPSVVLWYCNKNAFKDAGVAVPRNYEELLAATPTLVEKGLIPLALFAKEAWPGVQMYDYLVTRTEPRGINALETGATKITDPAYKRAAEQMLALVKAGILARGAFNTNYVQATELFKTGKAAIIQNGAWFLSDVASMGMGGYVDYFDNPLSLAGNAEASRWNMSGGKAPGGYAVWPKAKDLDFVVQIGFEVAQFEARGNSLFYARPNILTEEIVPEIAPAPIQVRFAEEMKKWKTTSKFPWHFQNAEIAAAFDQHVQRLLVAEMTADEFIATMKQAIDAARK